MIYGPTANLLQQMDAAVTIEAAAKAVRAWSEHATQLASRLEQLEVSHAAVVAELQAFIKALSQLDPQHPLLTDPALRQRIQDIGKAALAACRDWDHVRDAGESVRY